MEAMTVTRTPTDWRGSDLRSRSEVVKYLADRGRLIEDKTGLVVGKMREDLGRGRALAQLLADMEQDGMISREVRGRRTFRVELLDDWGLLDGHAPLSAVPDNAASDDGGTDDELIGSRDDLDLSGVDLTALAEALLAVVVKRMTSSAAPEGGPTQRELANELRRASSTINELQSELRQAREKNTTLQESLAAAKEMAARSEHNVEVLRGELKQLTSRKKRTDGGVPLGEQIGEDGRKALERLMKALPESPASKAAQR